MATSETNKKGQRIRWMALIGLVGAATAGFVALCWSGPAEVMVPRYDTPGWAERGSLMLRSDSAPGHPLLLAHVRDEDIFRISTEGERAVPDSTIFRFTLNPDKLHVADTTVWKNASGPTILMTAPFLQPFELGVSDDLLMYNGKPVETRGQTVMAAIGSANGEFVAVLSATGKRFGDLMPFLSRPHPSGARYHQVFRRSDGSEVGSPILLPFDRENDTFHPYWSADERYVVYPQTRFKYVAIIPTHLKHQTEDGK